LTDAAAYEATHGVPSSVHNDTDGDGDQDFDDIIERLGRNRTIPTSEILRLALLGLG